MKTHLLSFIVICFVASTYAFGPTKYKIQIVDSTGVIEEYETAGYLAGTNAYVLDVLVQTVMLFPAMFVPNGYIETNEGIISTGIGVRCFLKTVFSPVRHFLDAMRPIRLGNNTQSSKWITFTNSEGRQITITGKHHIIKEIQGIKKL